MNRVLLLVCLFILGFGSAIADPGATTRLLMNQPVSMLTYGIGQLRLELETDKKKISETADPEKITAIANYNYESDQIVITVICIYCGIESTEDKCADVIASIRSMAFMQNGKAILPGGSSFSIGFMQEGYTDLPKEVSQNLGNEIDKRLYVNVSIQAKEGAKETLILKKIDCEAPLLGTGYSIKR